MQHGFIDKNVHLGYNWGQYGKQFQKNMPLPNRILLYGEHWKNELDTDGFWSGCIDVVGSIRIDRYRLKRLKKNLGGSSRRVILWTTDGIAVEESIEFVKAAIYMLGSNYPMKLVIKLHPHAENLKDPYLNAFDGDNRVVVYLGNEGVSTFDHLVNSDMHLSISSTCLYEAISLGVPSVVLGLPSYEKVKPAIERGHCKLAMSPEDLARIFLKMELKNLPDQDKEYYFKYGALDNIRSVLNRFRKPLLS
jgi:UDP-N-acetylglucosamine 2-epimerase